MQTLVLSMQKSSAVQKLGGGGNFTFGCIFLVPGSRMFFCKDECQEENMLIETTSDRAQSGRYSVEYKEGSFLSANVFVSITRLKTSDSGQYTCGLDRNLLPDSFKEFELIVTEALQDGNTGLTNAQITTRTGTEGGNITVGCLFSASKSRRRFFCKGDCTTGNILIETTNDRAQSGRYSIEYEEEFYPSTQILMNVSITQLKKSDSGLYMCSLDIEWALDPNSEFKINVIEETTLQPFTASLSSTFTTTTQSLGSSSGRFTPSSSVTETNKEPETKSPAVSGFLLILIICVLVVLVMLGVVLLAVAVLLLRKNMRKNSYDLNLGTRPPNGVDNDYFINEDYPPVSAREESPYESLSPATTDRDQIYSTLTHTLHE
ncbi:hypothetical protein Q5P01_008216 [Channa striata]|uniref:Immunoglobulin domain-containing protein n=1 Tax=Channa striata TaxID=64152 RepID=A0AA88N511_CHASR|nr:hypothetical protein Q5P01_008216 [Channa striata]